MEKDIGKINKNSETDIVVRIDDYGGKRGVTIREFVTGERYTGFTKSGTRIPAGEFLKFRELINSVNLDELKGDKTEEKQESGEQKSLPEDSEEGLL